ncbi:phospholipase D-like domain-containing protein [Paracrocinitomix mangrovi]|uniref:phospholipase D-like domain-containing protein n=1 Tax=Paracrocinitomix mangrovi TaxID=2862509 RepID=UPI001C8EFD49|nr:phospholipase D-like domain-containing protein [Paracrocinitomix mangrovi]UKN02242.1 phospholipase D-like domain-containing protein [Paracrocinitomix mangrovi]
MRKRSNSNGLSIHAISGTHVVLLAFDTTPKAKNNLLGFAIHRTDHTEKEQYWLNGFKTFKEIDDNKIPGSLHSTLFHPIQSYLWGDYTAKPDHKYTFLIRPVYGSPKNLDYGDDVVITISTESEDDGEHAVFFNRGAIASQYFAKKFNNEAPDADNPTDPRTVWLSRGLLEAALKFIRQAKNGDYALKVAAYELNYIPILNEFKAAAQRGVDVQIVYEAGKVKKNGVWVETSTTVENKKSIKKAGIQNLTHKRTKRPAIPHNKFIILEKKGKPIEVWSGSTNFTRSGFLGQTNVGHIVRNSKMAEKFEEYWQQLRKDLPADELKLWNEQHTPTPKVEIAQKDTTLYFSPRKRSKMLGWYGDQIRKANQTLMFTAAFGVNKDLAPAIAEDEDFLRFLLIEKKLSDSVRPIIEAEKEIVISRGQTLGSSAIRYKTPGWKLDQWFMKEEHYRKKGHVFYVHTKILMLDLLTNDPKVFSGSANFSYNSLMSNDENMLLIRGNKRVADIYLTEFMRLFNHFYFRSIVNKLASNGQLNSERSAYLHSDDSWTDKYFKQGSYLSLRRELFN